MRLAFLGTPEAAVVVLDALVDAGHDVAVVVTRPDRRRGRGPELTPSPVARAARERGLTVVHRVADIEPYEVARGVVVAYGAMIPASVLARTPMLNVHFSLLPRWRGAAPVERAILAGDAVSGVSIMTLEATLDTGPVHLEQRVALDAKTVSELTDELARVGARALLEVLASPDLLASPTAQVGPATYAEKITGETLHLTPSMSGPLLERTVRLERAYLLVDGRRLAVRRAHVVTARDVPASTVARIGNEVVAAGERAALALDEVRPEGSRSMTGLAWWAGARWSEPPRWA
ncbi:MAG: methionyl-tRNA formyltransferase [Acidimicrobiales bacterium]